MGLVKVLLERVLLFLEKKCTGSMFSWSECEWEVGEGQRSDS